MKMDTTTEARHKRRNKVARVKQQEREVRQVLDGIAMNEHEEAVELVLQAKERGYATGWERVRVTVLVFKGAGVMMGSAYVSPLGMGFMTARVVGIRGEGLIVEREGRKVRMGWKDVKAVA